MTTCSLFVGWRGTGKSTLASYYSRVTEYPLVDRDAIRLKLNGGQRYFNPYSYNPEWEIAYMFETLMAAAARSDHVLLDAFTGYKSERARLVERLRDSGFTRVTAIRVVTPLEVSYRQFCKRELALGKKHIPKLYTYASDFALMEKESRDIEEEGFDSVSYFDARQLHLC